MKKSLTAKLFVFVLLIFMIQVFIQQAFQTYFLADYYQNQKISTIHKEFDLAKEKFAKTNDLVEQADILENYMFKTNEPILVIKDLYGYQTYHSATNIVAFENSVVIDIEGKEYTLAGLGFDESKDPSTYEFGDTAITVQGYETEDSFNPLYVTKDNMIVGDVYLNSADSVAIYKEGKETSIYTEKEATIVDYREVFLNQDIRNKIDVLSEYIYGFQQAEGNYQFLEDEIVSNGETLYVYSMLSLQPINEVIEIQNRFQWYLTGGMLILILAISFAFSRVVSKPILAVSKSAAEISKLNFDVKCDENRQDEIGVLSKSVNQLSTSLKEKIDALEDEIAFEKRQEKIRKEFVADVSHELKTPLGIIKSYSEGIKDGISQEKANHYLDVIVEEVDKMNGLVIDMLELSNLDAHETLHKERINMKRMLQHLIKPFENIDSEIQLELDLEDCLQNVDIKKMTLVITNILSNAFRYVDENKIINIKLTENQLSIENSHEPLSQMDLDKLWDRFYRVEKSRSKVFGGNGLGLSIVRKTLDLHEIEYDVSNSEIGFLFQMRF